ncbi:MAG TPA: sensor histidine kinase [Candidatus Binatia bacterium]|nr:sensor histidine kinase [Candidatus Binatia bacterium]
MSLNPSAPLRTRFRPRIFDFVRAKAQRLTFIRIFRGRRRERLVRDYFFVSVILIAGGLVSAGVLEIYFRYIEGLEQVGYTQQGAATAAALRIERFIQDVATTMKATTKSADPSSSRISKDFEFELKRLLFLAPVITEAIALDQDGVIRAQVSRFRAVAPSVGSDLWQSAAFRESRLGRSYFGTVYFRGSDPYVTVAVPIERLAGEVVGVLHAETSLRDILDVVSSLKLGSVGYAYVITRSFDLIAHANTSLVLQRRNLGHLEYVKAAFQPTPDTLRPRATVAYNVLGQKVFTSHALVPILGWAVFVEQPVEEAYAPIYASLLRTSILLLIGLGVALLASFLVARRVVWPLATLRQGVNQIASGDLNACLEIKTGDEIEMLADAFNRMATHLRDAYTGLERKVAERTQALTIANQKLAEASELKSQFLANVNHELRTPVSAILGYGGLVLSDTESHISTAQKANLQDLLKNAERLLNLIDSLLDIGMIEAGKLEVQIEAVELEEIIRSVTSTIEASIDKDHVRLIRNVAPNLPVLNTDRDKLKQILINLLDNAAKFTERGEIRISASQQNGALKLEVADTGIGINNEDLNQVFEEFRRGESSSTKKYRGTGLGLAIVKRLVGLLGGNIEVSSTVGEGSIFTVTLPMDYKGRRPAKITEL